MLNVLEMLSTIERVEELAALRDYHALSSVLEAAEPAAVLGDPVLRYYQILAALQTGRFPEAVSLGTDAKAFFDRHTDSPSFRKFLNVLGILLTHTGELSAAKDYFLQAIDLASRAGDRQLAGDATMNAGVVADIEQRWRDALSSHLRALTIFSELGDGAMVAACHHNLGMTYRQLGLLQDAQSQLELAREIASIHGARTEILSIALETALLFAFLGDLELAEAIARSAHHEIDELRSVRLKGEALRVLGIVRQRMGDDKTAARLLRKAEANAVHTENVLLQAECSEELARIYHRSGNGEGALEALTVAAGLYTRIGAVARARRLDNLL